jgi:hypothetical protein
LKFTNVSEEPAGSGYKVDGSSKTSVLYQTRQCHIPGDNPKEGNRFERLRVDERIILK